jgi:hypothetical protein
MNTDKLQRKSGAEDTALHTLPRGWDDAGRREAPGVRRFIAAPRPWQYVSTAHTRQFNRWRRKFDS